MTATLSVPIQCAAAGEQSTLNFGARAHLRRSSTPFLPMRPRSKLDLLGISCHAQGRRLDHPLGLQLRMREVPQDAGHDRVGAVIFPDDVGLFTLSEPQPHRVGVGPGNHRKRGLVAALHQLYRRRPRNAIDARVHQHQWERAIAAASARCTVDLAGWCRLVVGENAPQGDLPIRPVAQAPGPLGAPRIVIEDAFELCRGRERDELARVFEADAIDELAENRARQPPERGARGSAGGGWSRTEREDG